jgi:hypothetical protein
MVATAGIRYKAVNSSEESRHDARDSCMDRRDRVDENQLLERITVNPKILSGKPIICNRRLVGHERVEPLVIETAA